MLVDIIQLFIVDELIAQGFFGLGCAHCGLRLRVGDYALSMRGNYTIMDLVAGEQRYIHIGSHDGLSAQEMLVPLIVVDPH